MMGQKCKKTGYVTLTTPIRVVTRFLSFP